MYKKNLNANNFLHSSPHSQPRFPEANTLKSSVLGPSGGYRPMVCIYPRFSLCQL